MGELARWVELADAERGKAAERRAELSRQTRDFKSLDKSLNNAKPLARLMRAFQVEVDLLTKRSEAAESALRQAHVSFVEKEGAEDGVENRDEECRVLNARVVALEEALAEGRRKQQQSEDAKVEAEGILKQSFESELKTLEAEKKRLQDRNEELLAEREILKATVDQSTALAAESKQRATEKESAQSEALRALEEEVVALQKAAASRLTLQSQLAFRDSQAGELEKLLQQAVVDKERGGKEAAGELQRQRERMKGRIKELQAEKAALAKRMKEREEHWKKVYEEEQKMSRKVIPERDQAKYALRNAEELVERLGKTVAELQRTLDEERNSAASKDGSVTSLQTQVLEAKAEALVLQKHLETASIASDQTRRELDQAKELHGDQLQRLREQCDAAEQSLQDSKSEFAAEYQKLADRESLLRQQALEHAAVVRDLEGRAANEAKQALTLRLLHQGEIEALKRGFESERSELHQLLKSTQSQLASERAQVSALSEALHNVQKEAREQQQALDASQARVSVLESMIFQLESRLQLLIAQRATNPSSSSSASSLSSSSALPSSSSRSPFRQHDVGLDEWSSEMPDKPRSMQMDDDILNGPPSCLQSWGGAIGSQHRSTVARSTPNLRGHGSDAASDSAPSPWSLFGGLFSSPIKR